jgi:hypothetical protein
MAPEKTGAIREGETRGCAGILTTADGCLLTEYGNFIGCYDENAECGECGAPAVNGEDEVLIIECGNPEIHRKKIGDDDGYGPQTLGKVRDVGGDPSSRGAWGTSRSDYQSGAKYKEQVVRRDITHGSYEEHIYGDMHTTIEGTWYSKIKGHLWNTYYAKVHDDFDEEYESHFYGDITNKFGTENTPIDITETYYVGDHREEVHGDKIEKHFGNKREEVWPGAFGEGVETQINGGAVTNLALGMQSDLNVGLMNEAYLAIMISLYAALKLDVHATLTVTEKAVDFQHVSGAGICKVEGVEVWGATLWVGNDKLRIHT